MAAAALSLGLVAAAAATACGFVQHVARASTRSIHSNGRRPNGLLAGQGATAPQLPCHSGVALPAAGSVMDAVVVSESRESEPADAQLVALGLPLPGTPPYKWKTALLRRVAGLERGAAATELDDTKVRSLAEKLRLAALEEPRWSLQFPRDLPKLEGRWKLLYTSGFVGNGSPSLGGLRSGPPLESPLLTVGDIFQVYRTTESRADTVVMLQPPSWLRDTGIISALPFSSGRPDTTVTLSQQFDVASDDSLRFAFADGQVANELFEFLAPLKFPMTLFGAAPDTSRDGLFTDTLTTLYSDGDIRIGLGGRFGEIRVFQKVKAAY